MAVLTSQAATQINDIRGDGSGDVTTARMMAERLG